MNSSIKSILKTSDNYQHEEPQKKGVLVHSQKAYKHIKEFLENKRKCLIKMYGTKSPRLNIIIEPEELDIKVKKNTT